MTWNATSRTDGFRLLFVCTGNICRSPFAEVLARHLIAERLGPYYATRFGVSSAGVRAVVGSQMHPFTRDELMPWGIDGAPAGTFTARQLRTWMIREADLVLGANPTHRSAVVEWSPESMPNAFSLREFARLAQAVDPVELSHEPVRRARELVELARMRRGAVPVGRDGDRIPDPMGQSHAAHRQAAVLISEALGVIVGRLAPRDP